MSLFHCLMPLAIVLLPASLNAQVSLETAIPDPQKVVGGFIADPDAYPWIIQLVDDQSNHICGASLIAPNWVVTAGHCVQGMPGFIDPPTQVRINPFQNSNPQASTEIIEIDQIYIYPGFDVENTTYRPDVALIRLVSSSQTHDPIEVISDPTDLSLTEANDSCSVLGWGSTDEMGSQSDLMKQGDMVIIDQAVAATLNAGNQLFDIDSTICAGYLGGTPQVGAGAGDSGGPLFVRKNGEPLLIGVVSGGNGIITTETGPGIYTKLYTVRGWMNDIMNQSASIPEFPEGNITAFLGEGGLTIDSKMQLNSELKYTIRQLNGQLVAEGSCPIQVGKSFIPLNEQPASGVYLLVLESDPYYSVQKVMHY